MICISGEVSLLPDWLPLFLRVILGLVTAMLVLSVLRLLVLLIQALRKKPEGRRAERRKKRTMLLLTVCIGLAVLSAAAFLLLPRGLGRQREGRSSLAAGNAPERPVGAEGEEAVVTVRGESVFLGEGSVEPVGVEGVVSALSPLDPAEVPVVLIDDYAASAAYRAVRDVLTELGFSIREERLEGGMTMQRSRRHLLPTAYG